MLNHTRAFCYCFDQGNTIPAVISAQSLVDTLGTERSLVIYALTTDRSFDPGLIDPRGKDVRVEVHLVENRYDQFSGRGWISPATFLRLDLADHIPPEHGRALYLDCDVILLDDVCDVFDTDLAGTPVAAVPDYPLILGDKYWPDLTFSYGGQTYRSPEYMQEILGLDWKNFDYLSAGVLLVDLAKWPRVRDDAVAFMARMGKLDFLDQDAISAVLKGNFARLPLEYNAQSEIAFEDGRSRWQRFRGWGNDLHAIAKAWRTRAKIVHYAGGNKPWIESARPTALEAEWWRAAQRSKVFDRVAHLAHRQHLKVAPRPC